MLQVRIRQRSRDTSGGTLEWRSALRTELMIRGILMLAARTLHAEPPMNRAGRIGGTKVARRDGGVNFALFDDLIRPQQQRRRDGEADRLGGLEVDDQIELARLLNRKVTRLGTLEDPIDERTRSAPK